MPLRRRTSHFIGVILVGTIVTVLTLPVVVPAWRADLGRTFCYPFLGPVQRFNPELSDSLLARVRAHEQAHADQCRRDGSLWHNVRRLLPSQRLVAEAEAYCAEVRFRMANGGQARLVYPGALDELRDMRWFDRFSTLELGKALASQCPALAAQAAREEAEWRARRLHRGGA